MKEVSKNFVRHLTISDESAGQRIDNFLRKTLKGVPPSFIYRILRDGEVRVNGGRAKPERHLELGDTVRVPPVRLPSRVTEKEAATPSPMKRAAMKAGASLPIIYEDDDLLAVNKPSGIAVHGGSGVSFGVIEQLRAVRPDAKMLELVHRLDRDTSGVLLVAKKRSALTALHEIWRNGDVSKFYDVLVKGAWRDDKRRVTFALKRFLTADGERRVKVADDGQEALTVFYKKNVWKNHVPPVSLLTAELFTGRTHQIRVHLSHLGFPLAGDDKYGDFAWNKQLADEGLKRMFLHARELSFRHPKTGEPLRLTAELPTELQSYLSILG
jgi:23S rRNA pseudouridine955/2504/2580 synthase